MTDKEVSSGTKSSATLSNSLLSSPPRPPSSQGKERRNPSITPRKFKRFFTPRPRVSSEPSAARRALRDLHGSVLNRCQTPSSPLKPISEENGFDGLPSLQGPHRMSKRRKTQHHTPERLPSSHDSHLPSPLNTSPPIFETPELRSRLQSPISALRATKSHPNLRGVDDDVSEDEQELPVGPRSYVRPVPLSRRGLGGQLVQRMTGDISRASGQTLSRPVSDWRTETANFYSKPEDVHLNTSHEGAARSIPFCTTSCHKSTIVAVGDEEGYVRLLDSSNNFANIHLAFPAHGNAIIDLQFSEDDYLLATASGDQTSRVIDMMTQTPISILGHHTASVKQVRFQPGRGSNSVLATSGRDGSVQIWDLRCRGGPIQDVTIRHETGLHHRVSRPINPGCVVNSIYDAHARIVARGRHNNNTHTAHHPISGSSAPGDVARMGEVPGRFGEVSVTALQFLPPGREHLLLTACEADASVKLWDIRAIHTSRNASSGKSSTTNHPVSFTAPPPSHVAWRPFGIAAMALGGDGARLYALCKDNTVYAYSTAHLVLGHAPELAPAPPGGDPPRRTRHYHSGGGAGSAPSQGLGPLYGFRHPMFYATSFYVKAAVRPATAGGQSELLAVGSSDSCPVLFPTDERYLRDVWARGASGEDYFVGEPTAVQTSATRGDGPGRSSLRSSSAGGGRNCSGPPSLARSNSGGVVGGMFGAPGGRDADCAERDAAGARAREGGRRGDVDERGQAGDGGDDYVVRCWSEDRQAAADLRTGGETGGRRWGCGWADVGDGWDGDVDDWE